MRSGALATLVLGAALAGCAAPGSELGAGPYAGAGLGTRPTAAPARPVFATELAGPSTFLAPMPTAIVVLKPEDLNRNRAFCQAFTRRLPTAVAARTASTIAPNLILTRWLVQLGDVPIERATDCDFLVGTYDYARAARLTGALRLSEGRFAGPGPYLLMIIPDTTGLHVAGLDGSAYATADFDRFIDAWGGALQATQTRISQTPDQPGVLRSFLNLVSAILRTAAGGVAGLIRGTVAGL